MSALLQNMQIVEVRKRNTDGGVILDIHIETDSPYVLGVVISIPADQDAIAGVDIPMYDGKAFMLHAAFAEETKD